MWLTWQRGGGGGALRGGLTISGGAAVRQQGRPGATHVAAEGTHCVAGIKDFNMQAPSV